MTTPTPLTDLATAIVERARARGADHAEVVIRTGRETEVEIRNGAIEKLQQGAPRSIGLRLWIGDRSASTWSTDFRDDAVDRLLHETLALVPLTDPIPEQALADPALLARDVPDLDLWDEAISGVDADRRLQTLRVAERVALAHDPRITTGSGSSWSDTTMEHALALSTGFVGGWRESFVSFGVGVIADDTDARKRNGAWYTFGRHLAQLDDADLVGRTAADRALRQLGAGPIPTERLPVVFENRQAGALLGALFSCMKGGAIERRASYLIERLGQPIASEHVTIVDDPLIPRGTGSRPVDGEGLPVRRTVFVDRGVLQGWALNTYHARKLGLAPTGHASRPSSGPPGESSSNLRMLPGTTTPDALIAGTKRGFYCTGMMGFGFNAATGDFSRGASGFLIEDGVLTRPVSEVTLSANFLDLFGRIDAVADDLDPRLSTAAPTFRVAEMTLAGR